RGRRARRGAAEYLHPRPHRADARFCARSRARHLPGRPRAPFRRHRPGERRPVRELDAHVLAGTRAAAGVRRTTALVSGGGPARPGALPPRGFAPVLRRLSLAPHAPRRDARPGGRGGHGALPARRPHGRVRRSPGRRAVRRGRSAHPRARVVTVWNRLAVVGAAVLALVMIAEIRRRAATGPTGRRYFRHPTAAPALFVLAFFVTVALAAPLVTPYRPYFQIDITRLANHAPSEQNPLGTDPFGRDVWSRLVYGARISLGIGALAMLVAVTTGVVVGGVAGYFRRWVDATLMRLVDVGLAMPRMFML